MRNICVSILCLLLSAVAVGQDVGDVAVRGVVVDYRGEPVVRAQVAVYEKVEDYTHRESAGELLCDILKTDSEGTFSTTVRSSMQFSTFFVARKDGLALGWNVASNGLVNNKSVSTSIVLDKPCVLGGTVIDEKGQAIVGAEVQAVPRTSFPSGLDQRPIIAPKQWFTTRTSSKGGFRFDNLPADASSDFWVKAPERASTHKFTPNYLSACGYTVGRTDVRLVLPDEVAVRGRVVAEDTGEPVAGACVVIRSNSVKENINQYLNMQVSTNEDGEFCFDGVPAGRQYLEVSIPENEELQLAGQSIKMKVEEGKDIEDFVFKLAKGGVIEIVTRDAETQKGVGGVHIYIYQTSETGGPNFYQWFKTGEDGVLRIGAPTGQCGYSVNCWGKGYTHKTTGQKITVNEGEVSNLEVLLDRYENVSGVVLDESGKPAANAIVQGHPLGGQVIADGDGKFSLSFEDDEEEFHVFARDTEKNLVGITKVTNRQEPVTIHLEPAFALLGKILEPDGKGIPAAQVALTVNYPGSFSTFGGQLLSDKDGRFEIRAVPLPKGFSYRISVDALGYGGVNYKRIGFDGEPGTTVEIDPITLKRADQSISGILVDAEGKPAGGLPIFLHGLSSSVQTDRTTTSDANGCFTITRICGGPVRLQASFEGSPGGGGFMKAEGGDTNVRIVLGKKSVHMRYATLAGKALPDVNDLGIELSPDDAKDKMIVMCFFDMQQRPSRNCVMQLARRAEELKEKGVVIVAVQASKVEQNTLDEWVKSRSTAFPVGIIEGDEQEKQFAWGVKSLPWLILTDREHVVIAEGFMISELDEKLE